MTTELDLLKGQLEAVKKQLAEALAVNQMMGAELTARAQPTLGEVSDALTAFANAAEQGNPQAKRVLSQLFKEMDRARDAAGKITIVRNAN